MRARCALLAALTTVLISAFACPCGASLAAEIPSGAAGARQGVETVRRADGEITGPVGGALFGTLWGVIYSTIGLTVGTLVCFALGRLWGEPLIRPWLSEHHWEKMNFVIEAEGAIICFILYLIPGFPKDIISYLFGMSPMPFWVFAVVSTLGRIPGTWISSYFGAHVGEQQYLYAIAFIAIIAALCLPLYYYRDRIMARMRGRKSA